MGASLYPGGGGRGRRRARVPMSEINVTPFVDVMPLRNARTPFNRISSGLAPGPAGIVLHRYEGTQISPAGVSIRHAFGVVCKIGQETPRS